MIKKIKDIQLNTSKLPTNSSSRAISIHGEADGVFSLQVKNSAGKYYDFKTNLFETNYTSQSRLANIKLSSNPRLVNITFPTSSGGDTYTFYVWAESHFNTELSIGDVKQKSKYLWQDSIIQRPGNKTITFKWDYAAKSGITALGFSSSGAYPIDEIGTSSGSADKNLTSRTADKLEILQTIRTAPATEDFGFKLISADGDDPNRATFGDEVLFWRTGATTFETTSASTHDSGSTSTALVLNTVDDLHIGMKVHSIESNGSYASNAAEITEIDTSALTVTLSSAQTWASGKDIVFNAYGTDLIKAASGIGILTEDIIGTVKLKQISTTLRTAIASGATATDLDVNGTTGICVGSIPRCKFIEKESSSSACSVTGVSGHLTAGSITISNGQFAGPARTKTIIYIDGSSNSVTVEGTIKILKYITSDTNIYFDLTKVLVAGVNS